MAFQRTLEEGRHAMTSRERMLIALENGRPDRLPCQVHGWMDYYLNHYLGGIDWYEANAKFGLDYAIYVSPDYTYAKTSPSGKRTGVTWAWTRRAITAGRRRSSRRKESFTMPGLTTKSPPGKPST